MAFENSIISAEEINRLNVKSAADAYSNNSPRDNKNIFDKLPEHIAEKHNLLAKAVEEFAENVYTKDETEKAINEKMTAIGAGDMAKSVYDTDGDGVVDKAKEAENGLFTYVHSGNSLTGTGENGRFKAVAGGTYTSFTVNGTVCSVKCGEDTEIDLVDGAWYTFILDGNNINFKQGGAGLNFKIVGGTTQPASPKENTIWVNTDIAIGYWQFASTQPETRTDGTALQNGDLWIATANSGTAKLNALKKNGIVLFVGICKQWNGSVWETKNAYIYQNSMWQTFTMYLYNNGVSYAEWGTQNAVFSTNGNLTIRSSANYNYGRACLKTGFDATPWKTLKATVVAFSRPDSASTYNKIRLAPSYQLSVGGETGFSNLVEHTITSTGEKSIDISSVNTTAFLAIVVACYGTTTSSFSISKIWLE